MCKKTAVLCDCELTGTAIRSGHRQTYMMEAIITQEDGPVKPGDLIILYLPTGKTIATVKKIKKIYSESM